ncbi:hypothetical protein CBL_11455 [Carabus blaptoides fortunei]
MAPAMELVVSRECLRSLFVLEQDNERLSTTTTTGSCRCRAGGAAVICNLFRAVSRIRYAHYTYRFMGRPRPHLLPFYSQWNVLRQNRDKNQCVGRIEQAPPPVWFSLDPSRTNNQAHLLQKRVLANRQCQTRACSRRQTALNESYSSNFNLTDCGRSFHCALGVRTRFKETNSFERLKIYYCDWNRDKLVDASFTQGYARYLTEVASTAAVTGGNQHQSSRLLMCPVDDSQACLVAIVISPRIKERLSFVILSLWHILYTAWKTACAVLHRAFTAAVLSSDINNSGEPVPEYCVLENKGGFGLDIVDSVCLSKNNYAAVIRKALEFRRGALCR